MRKIAIPRTIAAVERERERELHFIKRKKTVKFNRIK